MAEIVTPIVAKQDKEGNDTFLIEDKHTIADILRLCQSQGWWSEMVSLAEIESKGIRLSDLAEAKKLLDKAPVPLYGRRISDRLTS